jgi:PDGLE domain
VRRPLLALVLALSVGLATAVSPFASAAPDGLERVAQTHGFAGAGTPHAVQEDAPLADYAFPGVADGRVATGMAGFAGTLAVFGLGHGLALALRRRAAASRAAA